MQSNSGSPAHTTIIDTLAGQSAEQQSRSSIQETGMGTLAVVICVWTFFATCAALFIRGASPRLERATVSAQRRAAVRASVAE